MEGEGGRGEGGMGGRGEGGSTSTASPPLMTLQLGRTQYRFGAVVCQQSTVRG
jgi:hypothetical protein